MASSGSASAVAASPPSGSLSTPAAATSPVLAVDSDDAAKKKKNSTRRRKRISVSSSDSESSGGEAPNPVAASVIAAKCRSSSPPPTSLAAMMRNCSLQGNVQLMPPNRKLLAVMRMASTAPTVSDTAGRTEEKVFFDCVGALRRRGIAILSFSWFDGKDTKQKENDILIIDRDVGGFFVIEVKQYTFKDTPANNKRKPAAIQTDITHINSQVQDGYKQGAALTGELARVFVKWVNADDERRNQWHMPDAAAASSSSSAAAAAASASSSSSSAAAAAAAASSPSVFVHVGHMVAMPDTDPVPPSATVLEHLQGNTDPMMWRAHCSTADAFNQRWQELLTLMLVSRGVVAAPFTASQWRLVEQYFEGIASPQLLLHGSKVAVQATLKEHLTVEQRILVESLRDKETVAVAGYAGTGKTLCLLHRARVLLKLSPRNRILIVLPSQWALQCFQDRHREELADLLVYADERATQAASQAAAKAAKKGIAPPVAGGPPLPPLYCVCADVLVSTLASAEERSSLTSFNHIMFDEFQLAFKAGKREDTIKLLSALWTNMDVRKAQMRSEQMDESNDAAAAAAAGAGAAAMSSSPPPPPSGDRQTCSMWLFYDDNQLHSRAHEDLSGTLQSCNFHMHCLSRVIRNSSPIFALVSKCYVGWNAMQPVDAKMFVQPSSGIHPNCERQRIADGAGRRRRLCLCNTIRRRVVLPGDSARPAWRVGFVV